MSKKKALFFVSPYFGGASRMTITIAKLLDRESYDVKFIVFGSEIKEIRNYLPKDYEVQLLHIKNIWDFTTLKMIRLFRKERPTHVFSSFRFLNFRVIAAAKFVGNVKIIVRNDNMLSTLRSDQRLLMKMTYPYADKIIVQQEEMYNELLSFLPMIKIKTVVCHNYLDTKVIDINLLEKSPYKNDNETRFVWAGRVTRDKGYEVLLKAFSIVRNSLPNAHLYLLGKYKEESSFFLKLQNYIVENKLSECVHFMGLVRNPHVYEKNADCFVLPSYIEGLPNALVEAMYIGVPVVATKCIPMISRMVDEGQNGYLVETGDYKKMAEAMIKAVSLKNCHTIYKPSTAEEYTCLFE
jgi:glycosyltransferase involved in cell wall biosynthesis